MPQQQPQAQPTPTPPKKKKVRVPRVVNGVETMVEIEVDEVAGPGWGPNDKHTLLNHRLTRVDGPLKVSGAAQYTYDVRLPKMLYGRILHCPHAHARVKKFDSSKASAMPGVKAIIQAPLKEFRFAGSPVAAVAASTPELAQDAARAIVVEYEVLSHVVRAQDAIKPESPEVLPRDPKKPDEKNLRLANKSGDAQKVEAAFAGCDAIVEAEYLTPRIHQWPNPYPLAEVAESIDRGEVYVAIVSGPPAATLTLQSEDLLFWGEQEKQDALYLHRLAVRRETYADLLATEVD